MGKNYCGIYSWAISDHLFYWNIDVRITIIDVIHESSLCKFTLKPKVINESFTRLASGSIYWHSVSLNLNSSTSQYLQPKNIQTHLLPATHNKHNTQHTRHAIHTYTDTHTHSTQGTQYTQIHRHTHTHAHKTHTQNTHTQNAHTKHTQNTHAKHYMFSNLTNLVCCRLLHENILHVYFRV